MHLAVLSYYLGKKSCVLFCARASLVRKISNGLKTVGSCSEWGSAITQPITDDVYIYVCVYICIMQATLAVSVIKK